MIYILALTVLSAFGYYMSGKANLLSSFAPLIGLFVVKTFISLPAYLMGVYFFPLLVFLGILLKLEMTFALNSV